MRASRENSWSLAWTTILIVLLTASNAVYGAAEKKPLVLVELFTSEGCSSCPAADRLLATLHTSQPVAEATVVALAYHVDYWDYLGWKDPFGEPAYSQRQRAYAAMHKEDRVYTPQMMVGGIHGFVGSDRGSANQSITKCAATPADLLDVDVVVGEKDGALKITLRSEVAVGAGSVVWVALAEDDLVSEVTRGENRGKTLTHQAVVRAVQQLPITEDTTLDAQHTLVIPWDAAWQRKHCRVVAVVQSESTGAVLALGQRSLGASE